MNELLQRTRDDALILRAIARYLCHIAAPPLRLLLFIITVAKSWRVSIEHGKSLQAVEGHV